MFLPFLFWSLGLSCKGSLIARKLAALGGSAGLASVLEWLLVTPSQPDGKVWGTELGEVCKTF